MKSSIMSGVQLDSSNEY